MAMIRWTQREWQQIAGRLAAGGVDPSLHGWRRELVSAMKGVLPKDRWRDPDCLNNAKQILVPLMKSAIPFAAVPPPQKEPPLPTLPTASQLTTEDLLVELARRLSVLFSTQVVAGASPPPVDRGFYPPPKQEAQEDPATRPPRILIVGPRNGQQEELSKAHPKLLLSFVASEDRPGLINKMADICDEIVVWTNFVNHQHTAHAKSSRRPMVLISGGLSSLHARLSDWDKLA